MDLLGVDLRSKTVASVLVATLAGLTIGFLLVPRAEDEDASAPPPPVRLLGTPLTLDDTASKKALEAVRAHVRGWFTLELPDGKTRQYGFGRLGVQIDRVRLDRLVRDARDPTSPLRRTLRRLDRHDPVDLPAALAIDVDKAVPALMELKDEYDHPPVDARLDLEKRELIKETPGRMLDIDATLLAVNRALERGERSARAVFQERKPRRVAADLGHVEFNEVLGFFETHYDRAQKSQARTYNLRLAASKLDGYVLLPGETFDFNEVVGPRDEANGYKVAPVIAEGELVDGIGGGTCQISGTLHGASFFAGLEIVERYPHTRPSSYIKMGLDATVVYPTINFRVKNPFDFPIVFHETVKEGIVRAEILGKRHTRAVTFIRRITDAIPYEQQERPDKTLPRGVRLLGQRGVAGFKVKRYRIVRDGDNAVRERWDDVYPPTSQIVRVGTGEMPRDSLKADDDPHPEYVADELLVVTQAPDIKPTGKGEDDGMLEERDPGRFGEYGWTKKSGMPVWEGTGNEKEKDKEKEKKGG